MVENIQTRLYGWYDIPAEQTTFADVNMWGPGIKDTKAPLVADIALIDHFGNEHWVKRVEFSYAGQAKGEQPATQE